MLESFCKIVEIAFWTFDKSIELPCSPLPRSELHWLEALVFGVEKRIKDVVFLQKAKSRCLLENLIDSEAS